MTTSEATPTIAPTLIRHARKGHVPELVGLDHAPEGKTLLVFASPEDAEAFRRESGRYPEAEGFSVAPVDPKGLEAIIWGFEYERVAVRGPMVEGDSSETISFFDADEFMGTFVARD